MSLKINGFGKILTNYTYAINLTNNKSIFMTIKYQRKNWYGCLENRVRVYELFADIRHPCLLNIKCQLENIMNSSSTSKVIVKDYSQRNYIEITWNGNFESYTGYTII